MFGVKHSKLPLMQSITMQSNTVLETICLRIM